MTLYEFLKENNLTFSRHDSSEIGKRCSAEATQIGIPYSKKRSKEQWGEKRINYTVREYPETFVNTIKKITDDYFEQKATVEIITPATSPIIQEKKKRPRINSKIPLFSP